MPHLKTSYRHFPAAINTYAVLRAVIVSGLVTIGGLGIVQQVAAQTTTTKTSTAYCSQYTSSSQLNACKDGIKGSDCGDYAITFDQEHADICTAAATAKASGKISDTPTISPSPSASATPDVSVNPTVYRNVVLKACDTYKTDAKAYQACLYGGSAQTGSSVNPKTNQDCLTNNDFKNNSKNQKACIAGSTAGQKYIADQAAKNGDGTAANSNPFSFLDQLDQSSTLSDFTDTLHQNGQDKGTDLSEVADDTVGSYINGAGKKQAINMIPCAGGGAASVVKSATNVNGVKEVTSAVGGKKCPAILFFNGGGWHSNDHTSDFVASGSSDRNGDSNQGSIGPPAGGGATQRGYTVLDVTYRLGSSSVYYAFEDVMRGIQSVVNNADGYGIDPNKIAIFGDSAGGSLSMRAAASGKTGAKVAVGWSPPTNAYTGLFRSYKSLLIGMDHSTCIPTDLAGLTNTTDLLNGGSGDVAQYGQGLSSNDFSSLGIGGDAGSGGGNPLGIITEVLTAGQYALKTGQNAESISKQLESGGIQGLSGGIMSLSSKKFTECLDNFNALSPALFASPETPPTFTAGFENDDVVGPEQVYGMRDKVLSLGVRAESLVLPGDPNAGNQAFGASGNHLGYNPLFVCKTLNFIDSVMNDNKGQVNCGTGVADNQGSTDVANSAGGSGGSGGGGGGAPGSDAANSAGGNSGGGAPDSGNSQDSGNDICRMKVPGGRTYQIHCNEMGATCSSNNGNPTNITKGGDGVWTCPATNIRGAANGCPSGLIPGSHGCVKPITNTTPITAVPKAPAPGSGATFEISRSASGDEIRKQIKWACPSNSATSIQHSDATTTYRCN